MGLEAGVRRASPVSPQRGGEASSMLLLILATHACRSDSSSYRCWALRLRSAKALPGSGFCGLRPGLLR